MLLVSLTRQKNEAFIRSTSDSFLKKKIPRPVDARHGLSWGISQLEICTTEPENTPNPDPRNSAHTSVLGRLQGKKCTHERAKNFPYRSGKEESNYTFKMECSCCQSTNSKMLLTILRLAGTPTNQLKFEKSLMKTYW